VETSTRCSLGRDPKSPLQLSDFVLGHTPRAPS
jgi:hypothetical protein